ncbi:MAG: TSUP family transporter [Luteolibacter sp.]
MKIILSALIIGLAAGLLGALCGVGGGIIMVPAFVGMLGLAHKNAVATSMAVIVVTAAAATINNATDESKLIDWKIVGITAVTAALAAWYGSDLMRSLNNQTLTRIFGVLLIALGVKMLWKP